MDDHLAKTYATNCGLSKGHLENQGLVSLRALWIGIHYPYRILRYRYPA